jgi:hypothetical protein
MAEGGVGEARAHNRIIRIRSISGAKAVGGSECLDHVMTLSSNLWLILFSINTLGILVRLAWGLEVESTGVGTGAQGSKVYSSMVSKCSVGKVVGTCIWVFARHAHGISVYASSTFGISAQVVE